MILGGVAEVTPEQELHFLKAEAQRMREALKDVEERVEELQKEKK